MSDPAFPRPFLVRRDQDVTGISGEGVVAEGVQFSDGWVVTHWLDKPPMNEPKTDVWHNKGATPFERIHGHGGSTNIVWADDTEQRRQMMADVIEAYAQGAAARAYALADRWQAAHGSSMFLVRAAGAELRDELDSTEECGHRLEPMMSGVVSGGPCVKRGPHEEHETADGTKFSPIGAAVPAPRPVIPWSGPEPAWADVLRAARNGQAEPEHDRPASSCSNPDHACVTCGDCVYEHPTAESCLLGQLPSTEGRPARTRCGASGDQEPTQPGDGEVELAREALLARVDEDQAEAVDRLIRAVERRNYCDLPHEMGD